MLEITSIKINPPKRGAFTATPTPQQFALIGEFINACSLVEVSIHAVLRATLQIDDNIARALIGERRLRDMLVLLRFAFESRKPPYFGDETLACLKRLCDRIEYINSIRAIVAHRPCATDGAELEFDNRLTAEKPTKLFLYRCTAMQLRVCSIFAVDLAVALRGAVCVPGWNEHQYVRNCTTLLASCETLDLPMSPDSTRPQTTPKPKRQRPSSQQKLQEKP